MNNTANNTGKWFGREHKTFVDIFDHRCVFFARLYKKSTPGAVEKANQIVNAFNNEERADNTFETLHEKLEDSQRGIERLKLYGRELEEKNAQLVLALRGNKDEPPKFVMQNKLNQANETIYNLSEALCNLSNK